MRKAKFYIILSLLIFSINLSSATIGDEISEDVVTDTSFTSTPMSYSLEDPDFDWLNLIIELDVQNLTEYEFEYSIYDNATNIYLYGGNNYFDTTYYGIQSVSVPIEGHYFYDMGIAGYIKIYVYLYETQNLTYLGQKEMVIWINSSNFELPPVYIDESTVVVTYFDIETNTNQTIANGATDLIFVDFIYNQQITGYFEGDGYYYSNQYIYSNNYYDAIEKPAGTYSYRLIFDVETLSNLGIFTLDFTIYSNFYYNNSYNYYYTPNYQFSRTTTGSMFEAPVYTVEFYGISFVDFDGNGLTDAYEIQFYVNSRKVVTLDMYVEVNLYDGFDWFYSYNDSQVLLFGGLNFVTVTLDATMLYNQAPYNYLGIYFSGTVQNYWDTFNLYNWTSWDNISVTHPNYDKPVVYIEKVTFNPGHNAATTLDLDGANYDYLMVNITVSSKIAGSLNYYLDFYDENTGYYLFYDSGYSDFSIGNTTFTYIVNASVLDSIWGGKLTLYSEVDIYDPTDGNYYYYYWTNSIYSFNPTDFNPSGYYIPPTTPVGPEPTDPGNTDPTDTDPTTTDPIDTNVVTNTTDTLNGTESTQATPDVPVLDLPAPSLYFTFISILAILIIKKKQSTLNK